MHWELKESQAWWENKLSENETISSMRTQEYFIFPLSSQ